MYPLEALMKTSLLTASLVALAAASPLTSPLAAQGQQTLAEACPNLTPEEIEGIENYQGEFSENAHYARAYCVSVEEAERRMAIQLQGATGPRSEPGPPPPPPAPDADIGTLQEVLHAQESETFAGLWIQHQPTYGVAVAFTRDAAATLAKYTSNPLFLPVERPGPSEAELRAAQDRIAGELQRLGVNWYGVGSDIKRGTVNVDLGQSADPIRAAAARGEFELPDYVVFNEPAPFPLTPPPIPPGDTRVKSFPQFANRTDGGISTLVGVPDVPARLELRDGCLWLYPEGEEPKVAIWERHEALDLTDPDRVAVMNLFGGSKVYAGTDVVLLGLQPNEAAPPTLAIGTEGCPGPYRVVRGIVPREVWDRSQREAALARREAELGSRAAAEADYAADKARLGELRAWRDMQIMERGDAIAQIWVQEDEATAHVFHTDAITLGAIVPEALRPFVKGQVVPVGRLALEAARDAIVPQLAAAGISAELRFDEIGGYVSLRPDDLEALSRAAQETPFEWPALVRIESDYAGPYYNPDLPGRRADPESIWYPLEAHPDFAAIRAIVERTPVERPAPPPPGETIDRWESYLPSGAGSLQQTHFLIAYGFDLDSIRKLTAAGYEPVTAIEYLNGRQTVERRAMAASDIVIAEPVGIDSADPGPDGYFSSVRWRVIETLKGDLAAGDEVRQRMAGGERNGENGQTGFFSGSEEPFLLPGLPFSLDPGTRWVLHLNDRLYRHTAFVHGGEGAARTEGDWYVASPWTSPALIGADGIARPVATYPEPFAVDDLREAVRPIQRALQGEE